VLDEALVAAQRGAVGELPSTVRARWTGELGLSAGAAATLTQHPEYTRFFNAVTALYPHPGKAANWIQTEVLRDTTSHGLDAKFPVSPEQVAELLGLVEAGKISGAQAKKVHASLVGTSRSAADVVAELGMSVVSDDAALRPIVQRVIDE